LAVGTVHTRQYGGMVINIVHLFTGALVLGLAFPVNRVAFGLIYYFCVKILPIQQRCFAVLDAVQIAVQDKGVVGVRVIQVGARGGANRDISKRAIAEIDKSYT